MERSGTGTRSSETAGRVGGRAWASALTALALAAVGGLSALGQDAPIEDNSFLIEEAYNQEPGVVQHISTLLVAGEGDGWSFGFTQEWPAPNQRHQLSYTLAFAEVEGAQATERGIGDVALNYRYQAKGFEGGALAFAPRLSLLVPTGDERDGLGSGALGVQVNLPLSVVLGERWVLHSNAGGTYVDAAVAPNGREADLATAALGQSLVWLARPKLNLLLEASWTRAEVFDDAGRRVREEVFLISPGVRGAIDLPSGLQIVPGVAVPIGVGPSGGDWSLFFYLSLEHPFGR